MKIIGKIINLENFSGLILAFLPIYLIKFTFWGMPSNLLEIMIGLAFIWWWLEKKYLNQKTVNFLGSHKTIAFFLSVLFLSLMVSSFLGVNWKVSLGILKGWFVFPFLMALISKDAFYGKETRAWKFFYAGAVLVAAEALAGFFLGQVTYDGRLQGIFNSPNYLAMFLSPALIVGWVLFTENKKKYGLSLIIITAALYLTYSSAAWIALGASLAILFLINKKTEKNKKKWLIFSAFLLMFFLLQIKIDKLDGLLDFNPRSSLASRIMIWKSAGKIISDNLLWGIGPGNFQDKYLEYQKYFPSYLEWAVPHPHNLFLTFYLFAGLSGAVAFLGLLAAWFKKIIPLLGEKRVSIALGIMLYFLLHGLVDTTYFKNDLALIFWLAFLLPLRFFKFKK